MAVPGGSTEQEGRELAGHNICIHGYSIGSGPATELTVRVTKDGQLPMGLILQYPIASTKAIGAVKSGSQAAGWIADKAFGFRNEDKIGQIPIPVAILQADVQDDFFAMAQILMNAASNAALGKVAGNHFHPEKMFGRITSWSDNGALWAKFGL